MVRSQSGPLASVPFTAMPSQRVSRIDSEEFRVLVLRRLRLPLPLSLGHHRAACSTLGRRGFAVENAHRSAVTSHHTDSRRLEVVGEGTGRTTDGVSLLEARKNKAELVQGNGRA